MTVDEFLAKGAASTVHVDPEALAEARAEINAWAKAELGVDFDAPAKPQPQSPQQTARVFVREHDGNGNIRVADVEFRVVRDDLGRIKKLKLYEGSQE